MDIQCSQASEADSYVETSYKRTINKTPSAITPEALVVHLQQAKKKRFFSHLLIMSGLHIMQHATCDMLHATNATHTSRRAECKTTNDCATRLPTRVGRIFHRVIPRCSETLCVEEWSHVRKSPHGNYSSASPRCDPPFPNQERWRESPSTRIAFVGSDRTWTKTSGESVNVDRADNTGRTSRLSDESAGQRLDASHPDTTVRSRRAPTTEAD